MLLRLVGGCCLLSSRKACSFCAMWVMRSVSGSVGSFTLGWGAFSTSLASRGWAAYGPAFRLVFGVFAVPWCARGRAAYGRLAFGRASLWCRIFAVWLGLRGRAAYGQLAPSRWPALAFDFELALQSGFDSVVALG